MITKFCKFIILLVTITFPLLGISQSKVCINTEEPETTLDVNGSIKVGNDNNNQQTSPGMIRFNPETGDFEGFDGIDWIPFTPDPKEFFWPAYRDRGAI
jgi:hypothetical protein